MHTSKERATGSVTSEKKATAQITPRLPATRQDLVEQVLKEQEAFVNGLPKLPDGTPIYPNDYIHYSVEDEVRAKINGEEAERWNEARRSMPWLFDH